jgi:hypothetical protein
MGKKGYIGHNKSVFKFLLTVHSKDIKDRLNIVFRELAEDVRVYIEDLHNLPIYTGNLADSTGVGVYNNGVLTAFAPIQRADMPQMYKGEFVWGSSLLERALSDGSYKYSKGIWIVLYSTVPYAVKVDSKGTSRTEAGYFSTRLKEDMLSQFKTAFAKQFPNIRLSI